MFPMHRRAWIIGRVAIAGLVAACKFPPPPDVPDDDDVDASVDASIDATVPPTFVLGGTLDGLWSGGAITLHLAAGPIDEDLTVSVGNPFTFTARLADTTTYVVTVVDDGPDHDCIVDNGSGTIRGADFHDLHVTCTNLIQHGIGLSIPTTFSFDPRVTHYTLPVSLLQQEVSITVSGPTLTGASVNGIDVGVGQASPPVAIGPGMTTIPVVVRKTALSQRYELVFDRGATPIVQASYARTGAPGNLDFFGHSAAAAGDFAAFGAPGEDSSSAGTNDDNTPDSGAVFVFRRAGTIWIFAQKLKGSALTGAGWFGGAIAMDGDVMVVGAPYDDARAQDAGSVYIFRLDVPTGRWNEEQRITATDAHAQDRFGWSVAVSGNRIAIGAPGHDAGLANSTNYGLVYLYGKNGAAWTEESRARNATPVAGTQLGTAVALDGDTLAAGPSPMVVWQRAGTTWTEDVLAATADGGAFALQGSTLAVGQQGDSGGAPQAGVVRVFTRTGATWSETAALRAAAPTMGAGLGALVGVRDNTIVATANAQRALFAFERVGGVWVGGGPPIAPADVTQSGWGTSLAISRYGAVVGDEFDAGLAPNAIAASGTAWFFR